MGITKPGKAGEECGKCKCKQLRLKETNAESVSLYEPTFLVKYNCLLCGKEVVYQYQNPHYVPIRILQEN